MILGLDNSLKEFCLQAGQYINDIESQMTRNIAGLQTELTGRLTELNSTYQQKTDGIQADIEAVQQEKTELRLQEQYVRQFNPFEKEMQELTAQIEELEKKRFLLTEQQVKKQQEIVRITSKT